MRVRLLGVRGSTPAPGAAFARIGGHTSCVAISADDGPPTLILDAGTGLRHLDALLGGRPFDGSLALTHLHWDHVMGLPFAGAFADPDSRARILVPAPGTDPAELLARMVGPPFFPADVRALGARLSFERLEAGSVETDGLRLEARLLPHGRSRALGFRVSDGRSALAYLPDHGPLGLDSDRGEASAFHPDALALCRDADLMVHDAQFGFGEEPAATATGHATAGYAVALAEAAGARRLLLFHHHPERVDEEVEALAAAHAAPGLGVSPAREGQELVLA